MRSTSADVQRQGYQEDHVPVPRHRKISRSETFVFDLGSANVRTLEGAAAATEIGSASFAEGMVETAVDDIAASRFRLGVGH